MSLSTLKGKSTWMALVGWTILAAIVAYPIYRHNQNLCDSSLLGQDGCELAGAAPSFWTPFIPIWLIGIVVGGIVLLVVRASASSPTAND
jgi:hypothetical protein